MTAKRKKTIREGPRLVTMTVDLWTQAPLSELRAAYRRALTWKTEVRSVRALVRKRVRV